MPARLSIHLDPYRPCRKEGCDAPLMQGSQTMINEERETPRFKDGTPDLFSPFAGKIVMRVILIEEVCEAGHRASWERWVPTGGMPFDLPPVFTDPSGVYSDADGIIHPLI